MSESKREPQLRECLATIDELTATNTKLRAKLQRTKQRLKASARAATTKQQTQHERAPKDSATRSPSTALPSNDNDIDAISTLRSELATLTTQLASRERESVALLQSLSEQQEAHKRQLEQQLATTTTSHREQLHASESAHVAQLASYMDDVGAKLELLERTNEALRRDKQTLEACVAAAQQQQQQDTVHRPPSRIVTVRDQASETEHETDEQTRQTASGHRNLGTRVHDLEHQLQQEKRDHTSLRKAMQTLEQQAQTQTQTHTDAATTMKAKVDALRLAIERDVSAFKAASDATTLESTRRIAFLTACVDACAQLVDRPRGEVLTLQDIHETLVTVADKVVTATTAAAAVHNPQRKTPARDNSVVTTHSVATSLLDADELRWDVRTATLEQQLRSTQLRNDTLCDTLQQSELQLCELRDELKQRVAREQTLVAKISALRHERRTLRTHVAAIATRYDELRSALQQQTHALETAQSDVVRLRSALQRKTELHSCSKHRVAALDAELQRATQRIDALVGAEKKSLIQQQRSKEQLHAAQDAKRQVEICEAREEQLVGALETEKAHGASLQMRLKALRVENVTLRSQIKEHRTKAVGRQQCDNLRANNSSQQPPAIAPTTTATAMPTLSSEQTEVRALRKRVLQKQQLLLVLRAKLTDQDRDVAHLRTRALAAAETNRALQLDLSAQRESAMRLVATMRTEMDDALALRNAQLDGLRASVYDALEAFVHCGPNKYSTKHESPTATDAASSAEWSNASVLTMRRWTELSTSDLATLHQRCPEEQQRAKLQTQTKARELLSDVEQALEQQPADCRDALCRVLAFLSARASGHLTAPSC